MMVQECGEIPQFDESLFIAKHKEALGSVWLEARRLEVLEMRLELLVVKNSFLSVVVLLYFIVLCLVHVYLLIAIKIELYFKCLLHKFFLTLQTHLVVHVNYLLRGFIFISFSRESPRCYIFAI